MPSRSPPSLQPRKNEAPPPIITRVFAAPESSLSPKLSAAAMLPRPSPLRREMSFGEGSALSEGSTRKRGRSEASTQGGMQGSSGQVGLPAVPSPSTVPEDETNKRPRLAGVTAGSETDMEGLKPEIDAGQGRLRSVSSPTVVPAGGAGDPSYHWWSWSRSTLPSSASPIPSTKSTAPSSEASGRPDRSLPQQESFNSEPVGQLLPPTASIPLLDGSLPPSNLDSSLSAPNACIPPSAPKPVDLPKMGWFRSLRRTRSVISRSQPLRNSDPIPPVPPVPPTDSSQPSAVSTVTPHTPPRATSPIPIPTPPSTLAPPSTPPSRSWYPTHRATPSAHNSGRSTPYPPLESPDVTVPIPPFMDRRHDSGANRSLSTSPVDRTLVLHPAPPQQLSALNASTLRYTLSLPLLGRPKARLQDVIPKEQCSSSDFTAVQGAAPALEVVVQPPTPGPVASRRVEEALVTTGSPNVEPSAVTPRSDDADAAWWWSYLGFAPARQPALPNPEVPPPSIAPESMTSVPVPREIDTIRAPEPATPSTVPVKPVAASVFSAETGKASLWYQPWYWYTAESAPRAGLMTPPIEEVNSDGLTEAERVKEDALARDQAQQLEQEEKQEQARAPTPPANPLLAPANKGMWVSFFSSRNPARPAIADGTKPEMEVMNIDEETPATTSTANPVSNSAVAQPKKTKAASIAEEVPKVVSSALSKDPPLRTSEPPKDPPMPPLTSSKNKGTADLPKPRSSSAPTGKTVTPPIPNFLLPTYPDVFYHPPLSIRPKALQSALQKTLKLVNKFMATPPAPVDPEVAEYERKWKGKAKESETDRLLLEGLPGAMPRSWAVLGQDKFGELKGVKKAVVIGIHGWFPGAIMRSVLGEPTGTSTKFAQMQRDALSQYLDKHDVKLDSLTQIALEGEGTIQSRFDKLYNALISNDEWRTALREADIILFATHSQGSVVSCHILDRLIKEGHIRTEKNGAVGADMLVNMATKGHVAQRKPQRVVCLALCGIHLGPLLYLNTSTLTQPFLQYLESAAARELFEFQDSNSQVSKRYVAALGRVLDSGCKVVYVASLNDQVVPIYSGAFTSASHPLILRALYIDGDAYSSTDFLTNLLVLCLRLRNAGLSDGGLVVHLSEATAGSLNGVGHSTVYEEMSCYSLAVRFLFETNNGTGLAPPLEIEPFSARESRNDYEIPWILNELVTHPAVQEWFSSEIEELRAAFDEWKPKTAALKDIRKKLEPIKRGVRGRLRTVTGSSRL